MGNLDTNAIKELSEDIKAHINSAEEILIKCCKGEGVVDHIDELCHFFHNVKGTSGMFGLVIIPEFLHVAESTLDEYLKNKIVLNNQSAPVFIEVIDQFKTSLSFVLEHGEEADDHPYHLMDKVQRLKKLARGEESEKTNKNVDGEEDGKESSQKEKDNSIRPSSKNLEELIEMVGQFIQIQNQLESVLGDKAEYCPLKDEVRNFASRLQSFILKVQLTPIAPLLKEMNSILMHACQETNKIATLEIIGGDTQFDHRAIDLLRDPLIHMIRNSIDHGIEGPKEREAAHKNKEGVIIFEAFQRSGQVILTMSDDGKGISSDRVKQKALEKEIIAPDEAENMSEEEILNLIFRAGFSTTDQETSLSGNGVGMDTVKNVVESMGGQITLATKVGKGTTVTLSLPLNMAVVKSVVFYVDDQLYAIAENNIYEILTHEMAVSRNQIAILENGDLALNIKHQVITVFSLHNFFACQNIPKKKQKNNVQTDPLLPTKIKDKNLKFTYIVVNYKGHLFALQTHNILGPRDFFSQAVPQFYKNIKFINGVNRKNTGEYIALLDLGIFNKLVKKIDGLETFKDFNKGHDTVSDVFRSEMRLKQLGVVRSTHTITEESFQTSIQRVLIFEINNKRYGVEIIHLKSISKYSVPTRMPLIANYVGQYVGFRGYPIMVLDLRYLANGDMSKEPKQIVVGLTNGMICALWVDEIIKVSIRDEMDNSSVMKNTELWQKKGKDYISGLLKDVLSLDNQAIGLLCINKLQSFLNIVEGRMADRVAERMADLCEDHGQEAKVEKRPRMLNAS